MRANGVAVAVAVAASLVPVGVAPAAVADEPPHPCAPEFMALREATAGVDYGEHRNADKDRDGLLGKIAAADDKFSQGKAVDSDAKLADYQAKVDQLLAAGKLVEPEGVSLFDLAAQTRECVLPGF